MSASIVQQESLVCQGLGGQCHSSRSVVSWVQDGSLVGSQIQVYLGTILIIGLDQSLG